MNLGLSESLKAAFPNIIPATRPQISKELIPDPNWLVGFTSGEGCFFVNISISNTHKFGMSVKLKFQITQHNRDQDLMNSLISYFDCGYINKSQFTCLDFIVTKFYCASYIDEKIIPFFSKYKIQEVKQLDFIDFCKAAEIIKAKAHLTERGLVLLKIIKIKASMNKGRY